MIGTFSGRALVALSILGLAGCGQAPKDPLEGKRLSVMKHDVTFRQELDTDSIDVDIPDAIDLSDWPQNGYGASHKMYHAEFKGPSKVLWTQNIGAGATKERMLTAPLVGGDGILFAMDAVHGIVALNAETGAELWSLDAPQHTSTTGGGIALEEESLYATYPTGDIIKINAKTGEKIWEHHYPYALRSAPTVFGGRLYCLSSNNMLLAMSAETGEKIWAHAGLEENLMLVGSGAPAATSLVVLAPYSSGDLHALYPPNGQSLWSDTLGSSRGLDSRSMIGQLMALPVIDDKMAFVVSHSDSLIAYDVTHGRRLWEKPIGAVNTPFITDDFLYIVSNTNEAICLTRSTGRVVWVHQLPTYENPGDSKGRIHWTGPLLAGGKLLIVGTNSQAVALSPQDGQVLEIFDLPGPVQSPPIVMNGILYVLTTHGSVAAIQ